MASSCTVAGLDAQGKREIRSDGRNSTWGDDVDPMPHVDCLLGQGGDDVIGLSIVYFHNLQERTGSVSRQEYVGKQGHNSNQNAQDPAACRVL